jgi:hypothetical protein
MQEPTPCRDQPRIPVNVLGIEVSQHLDWDTAAEAGRQVRVY